MVTVLYLVTAIIFLSTLLPLSKSPKWWFRGFDFPRVQFFSLATACILIFGIWAFIPGNLNTTSSPIWPALAILLLCCLYQGLWIFPYTRFATPETPKIAQAPDDTRTFSLITANVLTPNRQAEQLLKLVHEHKPDVLLTLESDTWWQTQLDSLEDEYRYTIKCPLDNLYGMHLYSKLKLSESTIEYLIEENVPSIHTTIELVCGATIRAHFLHPAPPSPTENEESLERDAELLIVAKRLDGSQQPIIVSGDINDVAWSRTTRLFRKLSGLLDPRVGRGMFNTYHAQYPFLRWPLDHLFHSAHFSLLDIQRLDYFGSDHFPLYTRLYLNKQEQDIAPSVSATQDDKALAQEIIHDQKKKQANADDA